MLRVQQFEHALKELAQLYAETPADATFDEAWKDVRKILTPAAGPLIQQLARHNRVSGTLLEELRKVTRGRNTLAHEYLLWYVLQRNLNEVDTDEQIAYLQAAEQHFNTLDAELSELSRELLREQGINPDKDYITEEEGREILREMLSEQDNAEER
jgi:hypothetical protein